MLEEVQKTSDIFFEKLSIHIESMTIQEENNNHFFIKIFSDDSEIIIWNNGDTLNDIEKILSLILSHSSNMRIGVQIGVNDYLAQKDTMLFQLIDKKINECINTNKQIQLPYYSAYERKKIHNYISNKKVSNVVTRSDGEGKNRRLYICKKPKKMTIDINWTEI